MSLVKCKECGQEVSSRARRCPHCGVRNPAPISPLLKKILVVIAIALVPAIVLMALTNSSNPTSVIPTVQQGNQVEVSNATMACPGENDLLNFEYNNDDAVQAGDTARQQDAATEAIQAGCKMEPAGTTGVAMTVLDDTTVAGSGVDTIVTDPHPIDQLWLPDKEVLWFNGHDVVPSSH